MNNSNRSEAGRAKGPVGKVWDRAGLSALCALLLVWAGAGSEAMAAAAASCAEIVVTRTYTSSNSAKTDTLATLASIRLVGAPANNGGSSCTYSFSGNVFTYKKCSGTFSFTGPAASCPAPVDTLDVSQVPLGVGGQVEPNILYIIDDSGSMDLSFLPDGLCDERTTKRVKSSYYNTLYYDPVITYTPPLNENGASLGDSTFAAAKPDGYSSSSTPINLGTKYRATWSGSSTGCSDSNAYADSADTAAYYYVFDATNTGCDGTAADEDCYDKVTVSANSGPGGSDERTNFANWYSYYRTRLMTAKAGTSRAFAKLDAWPRVAYGQINQGSSSIDGISTTTIKRGARAFTGTDRKAFFDWVFGVTGNSYTPLRQALDAAGQYFSRADDKGPYSTTPGTAGGKLLSCRHNYTVLMTDGYWNSTQASTSGARSNNDGTDGTTISGTGGKSYKYVAASPFKDSYSNTLADVAMYYWKNDLASTLDNNVPSSTQNPAFWQHMVTFGVGLGVPTAVSPDDAFAAMSTGATINWPDPQVSYSGYSDLPAGRADDLLHAAINGHGGFFSAQNPNDFANSLIGTLGAIVNRARSSFTAMVVNSVVLSANSLTYQATVDTTDWSGSLIAYSLQVKDNLLVKTEEWDAGDKFPAPASRNILSNSGSTSGGLTGKGIDFKWSSLSGTQQTQLGSSDVLDYLRGDQSKEVAKGGGYRNRSSLLGDIVNSDPVFVWKDSFGYQDLASAAGGGTTYTDFVSAKASRVPAVFVGANDGMLHGFNANTGVELFAYVPAAVYANLKSLSSPDYQHRYFVDGDIHVSDAYLSGAWHTVLLGATGAGGTAVFALDVTDPSDVTSAEVMWEFTEAGDLGYTIGKPVIGRLVDGTWAAIFGNGYASSNKNAVLYIVNLATGALIKKIDTGVGGSGAENGLSSPAFVTAADGSVSYVYAGDLQGNLWKFDLTGKSSSNWDVAFKQGANSLPLFTAKNGDKKVQPITVEPEVEYHEKGGYLIIFGTGKFFGTSDPADTTTQSLYGIWDDGSTRITVTDRSVLQQQTIQTETSVGDFGVRAVSKNGVDWASKHGWYMDLLSPPSTQEGERVIHPPRIWFDRIEFMTTIPATDLCSGGIRGWLMELNYRTGGRLDHTVFDLNGDGVIDVKDQVNGADPSGLQRGGTGLPPTVFDGEHEYLIPEGDKDGLATQTNLADIAGRKSWRELNR